mmetsp:Transcript_36164/g.66189  ORF Transcript_36164/g.66189 Transcript_36164/m.66189 type:complete len:81 (-) Transcript_36164:268-510(-)
MEYPDAMTELGLKSGCTSGGVTMETLAGKESQSSLRMASYKRCLNSSVSAPDFAVSVAEHTDLVVQSSPKEAKWSCCKGG